MNPAQQDDTYDAFISYRRSDGSAISSWLRNKLQRYKLPTPLAAGRTTLLFDQTIERAVRGAAAFIALCSPAYLGSDYCKRELRCFAEKVKGEPAGAKVGDRARIIPVPLCDISYEKWPREFPRASGFGFFRTQDASKLGTPCAPDSEEFDARLWKLADSIVSLLEALEASPKIQNEPPAACSSNDNGTSMAQVPRSGPSSEEKGLRRIFLGDVADSLRQERTQLAKQLREGGMAVSVDVPPPYESHLHDEHVKTALDGSLASIHLFDGSLTRPMEGDLETTYPERQYELALRSPVAQIVWVPSNETQPGEPELGALPVLSGNPEMQKAGLHTLILSRKEDLVERVYNSIRDLGRRENERRAANTVLLDFHSKDFQYALEADRQCRESGLLTLAGPDADNPRANTMLFTQRLREAGTVVVAFGRVSEAWVRERINAALQTIVTADCPTKQLIVYLAPPPKAAFSVRPRLGNIGLSALDHSQGLEHSPDLGVHIVQMFSSGRL